MLPILSKTYASSASVNSNITWEKDLDRIKIPGFWGAFPSDRLPNPPILHPNRVFSFIANTQVAGQLGEHWLTIYFPPSQNYRHKVLFLEPYGTNLHLTNPHFARYLQRNALIVETLPFGIQPLHTNSTACGQYCVFLIAHLPHYHYNINLLCRCEFSATDRLFNEHKVIRWWKYNYKRLLQIPRN